jgi:hypothetical protein
MMHHSYILETLARERQSELLREADAHRLICRAERKRSMLASLLEGMALALNALTNSNSKRLSAKDSSFAD